MPCFHWALQGLNLRLRPCEDSGNGPGNVAEPLGNKGELDGKGSQNQENAMFGLQAVFTLPAAYPCGLHELDFSGLYSSSSSPRTSAISRRRFATAFRR